MTSQKKLCFFVVMSLFFVAVLGTTPVFAKDKDTLVVANAADLKTLDPINTGDAASANAFWQIYDYLIFQDEDGNLVPRLAESWEQPDNLTYVLHLKKGVKFHNGEPFTAEDAKFTIDRGITSKTSTGSHVLLKDIKDVEIVDASTIKINMKQPYTPLLYAFTEVWGGVVNKKTVMEKGEEYERNPVGTGPFKYVSWTKGDRLVLERFDEYHGGRAPFKNLIIRAIPEVSIRSIELESGAIDVAYQIHVSDIKRIEEHPELNLLRRTALRTDFLMFNCGKPPFNDVRVRRAVVKALDIEGMQKAVYRGLGYVPGGPLPKDMRYSNPELRPSQQNVEEAKRLLEEAGVKNLKIMLSTSEAKERIDAATIVQNQLAEVGIDASIQVLEYGVFLDTLDRGEHQVAFSGWGNNLPDPEFALSRLYHTRAMGSTNNAFYSNPVFDALLDKGTLIPDGPERAAVYKEVQDIFVEEVPAVYWTVQEIVVGTNKRIKKFPLHIRGIYELWKIELQD